MLLFRVWKRWAATIYQISWCVRSLRGLELNTHSLDRMPFMKHVMRVWQEHDANAKKINPLLEISKKSSSVEISINCQAAHEVHPKTIQFHNFHVSNNSNLTLMTLLIIPQTWALAFHETSWKTNVVSDQLIESQHTDLITEQQEPEEENIIKTSELCWQRKNYTK